MQVNSEGFSGWRVIIKSDGLVGCIHRSEFQKTRNHCVSQAGSASFLRCRKGTPTQLDPLERASLNHWII
jgi:hypothetical protein